MHKHKKFVTTHVVPVKTNGTLYRFPYTLRDVYAFRVRTFTCRSPLSTSSDIIHVICPDLVSGYRGASQSGELLHSIAQFVPSSYSTASVTKQHKHYTMIDMEINHLSFYFVRAPLPPPGPSTTSHIDFDPMDNPFIIIDFWHRNKHVD